ncbi:retrovirus-related pol polyprotein from transposon TNT 1-94 [Tanacetum coccineum]
MKNEMVRTSWKFYYAMSSLYLSCVLVSSTIQLGRVKICDVVTQNCRLTKNHIHKLFDIIKQYHNKVNEIRAKKLARNANPLALVAVAQLSRYILSSTKISQIICTTSTTSSYQPDSCFHTRNQRTVAGARKTIGNQVVQQTGIQCFNCKEFGHFAKECKKPKWAIKIMLYLRSRCVMNWKILFVHGKRQEMRIALHDQEIKLESPGSIKNCQLEKRGRTYLMKDTLGLLTRQNFQSDKAIKTKSNLYTISLQETSSPTPVCFMAKASPTQAWLWHRRLSHLNFGTINLLSKKDIMNGLPKVEICQGSTVFIL